MLADLTGIIKASWNNLGSKAEPEVTGVQLREPSPVNLKNLYLAF